MRRVIYLVLFATLAVSAFAAQQNDVALASVFTEISAASDYTEVTFSLPDISVEDVELDGVIYQQLSHPLAGATRRLGFPELPTFSTMLAVPRGVDVTVELVSDEKESMGVMRVYPAQKLDESTTSPVFVSSEVYSGRQAYSQEPVMVSEPAVMRDFNLVNCTVNPFVWDSATGELTARTNMVLRVHHERQVTPPTTISRSFEPLYKSVISNYDNIMRDVEPEYQPRSMIVIRPSNTGIDQQIEQYMEWKRAKGFIVYEYTGSNSASTIRSYLQDAYENWENPPEYIVIIGDVGGTFNVPTFYESTFNGEGDHMYACLDGTDLLPEAFVGRISISSQNEFLTFLSKLNLYERNTYMDNPDFYHHSLLVGDTGPSGLSCIVTNKHLKELLLAEDPTHTFTELYGDNPNPSQMDNAINDGSLFFNYRGWIGMSGWGTSNIQNLTNIDELCNALILTCDTGSFASGTSRTEAFIRIGSSSEPRGAVSAVGMSTSHTHTRFNNILQGGMHYGLFCDRMDNMGEAVMRGKLALYMAYWGTDPGAVDQFTYWCNLIGDPTLQVWRTLPKLMNATFTANVPLGQDWIDVVVTDANNQPVPDAWVTARKGEDFTVSGYTDDNGAVTLQFENTSSGDVSLVITKGDYKPILGEFTIAPTGSIAYEALTMVELSGNGNNQPNPGEMMELTVTLHNFTSGAISGLAGILDCDSDYIDVTTNQQNFETLPAGGNGSSNDPFVISIANDAPDRLEERMDLVLTDGSDNWVVSFWITIQGADLDIVVLTVNDGGNGALDPGETALMTFMVKNNGVYDLSGVEVELIDNSSYLVMIDSIATLGDLSAGAHATTESFELTAMAQLLVGMTAEVTVRFTTDDGYLEDEIFEIPIGVVSVDDPLGPDNYGYICFDNGDTGYVDAPVYEWIEIDPNAGGSGDDTGIDDMVDEGDDNAYIDLPFNFRFYGQQYDHITVNSNGWIAMGDTESLCFRHWPVPGPLGPTGMIAAFWADLRTNAVYTYYDASIDAFIVEWASATPAGGSGNLSFQVVLYNPLTHPTSTGDGMIKVQYRQVSNTYFCVGIESHNGVDGMQYVYNNVYPTAARNIEADRAILFTSIPVAYEEAFITLATTSVHDSNSNSYIEAGENINLGCMLTNIGLVTANGITASLRSTDPLVSITDSTATYPDIEPGMGAYGLDFVSFSVDPAAQDGNMLALSLHIESTQNTWDYPISLRVYKPMFTLQSFLIYDGDGNGNGVADPGETVQLAVNLLNGSPTMATDVAGIMTTNSPYATIVNSTHEYGDIFPESAIQGVFEVELSAATPVETFVPLTLNIASQNADPATLDLGLGVSVSPEVLDEDFSSGWLPEGWSIDTSAENWSQSQTNSAGGVSPEARLSWTPSFQGISHLISNPMNLMGATNVSIEFNHTVNDFNSGSYPYVLGLAIKSDASDWESVWEIDGQNILEQTITLPITSNLLNQPDFQFGWYLSGNSYGINYWYIDDIYLNATLGNSAIVSGEVELLGGETAFDHATVNVGGVGVRPDEFGGYMAYTSPGEYAQIAATAPFYSEDVIYNIELEFGEILDEQDFELHWLAPADTLFVTFDEEESRAQLSWQYTEPEQTRKGQMSDRNTPADRQTFEDFRIWRRFDTGEFVLVDSTTALEWSEVIDTLHTNTYYVTVKYAEGFSDSTNHVNTSEWNPNAVGGEINPYTDWLGSNYPNPFNPSTTFRFSIAETGDVKLKIYNVRGQLVRTLVNERMEAGGHEITWHGDDSHGNSVATGVYFYRLETPRKTLVRKSLLLK